MFHTRKNAIFRFNLLVILFFAMWGFVIVFIAGKIMVLDREEWKTVEEDYKRKKKIGSNIEIPARRGNILDDKGELLVSTLPQYRIFIDFKYINRDNPKEEEEIRLQRDTLWTKHMDEICRRLNEILPGSSEKEFRRILTNGWKKGRGGVRLYNGRITYTQYKQIMELPIFNMGWTYSGARAEQEIERRKIYGDTGCSTLGIFRRTEKEDSTFTEEIQGLEETYDSYLRGTAGVGHRAKVGGKFIIRTDTAPQNGYDVQTTLNAEMMDICYEAVEDVLKKKNLAAGWAILMETKSGDIKAIVNLTRSVSANGNVSYFETSEIIPYNSTPNHALCGRNEPGSIFKTVALTAALDDGKITIKDSVIAYRSKRHTFGSHTVSDLMYRGPEGKPSTLYSMREAMMYSSNIALVQYIQKAYGKDYNAYINTLRRLGVLDNYKIIDREVTPSITTPEDTGWGSSTFNTLSYGYGVSTTALNIVSFYNMIANDGKQIKPRLVKAILNEGEVIEEFPTVVLNEQQISKETAETVTGLLIEVVNGLGKIGWNKGKFDGTGKQARSEMMTIAGKTGTANKPSSHKKGYGKEKLMSFCGFFPAEDPEYTLIVQMHYDKLIDPNAKDDSDNNDGGGSTSAIAFKTIAEKIMAKKMTRTIDEAIDQKGNNEPKIKNGNFEEASLVLDSLGLKQPDEKILQKKAWGTIGNDRNGNLTGQAMDLDNKTVPDVRGMGAKDAVYLLQNCNLNVEIEGYGTVASQSIKAGSKAVRGEKIELQLKP